MDIREKLVELLGNIYLPMTDGHNTIGEYNIPHKFKEKIADYLISNGVTVQDGKPLDAFLHPVDAYKGLKAKYLVFKADTGERVGNCFVLCPDKDPAAVEAIRAYARATDNETLAEDIYNLVGKGEPVQEWISQTELPWMGEEIAKLCIRYMEDYADFHGYASSKKVKAHIVRLLELEKGGRIAILPQPPKGE